jgi:hypothetical protein
MIPQLKEVRSFLEMLNNHQVEYMIIGGVAVNVHGYSRATGDLDIWYNPTKENLEKLLSAITSFGFDTSDIGGDIKQPLEKFIRIPLEGFYVELLAMIDGKMEYEDVYRRCFDFKIHNTLNVNVIGYNDLIKNKIMSRRAKDIEDIAQLEKRKSIKEDLPDQDRRIDF